MQPFVFGCVHGPVAGDWGWARLDLWHEETLPGILPNLTPGSPVTDLSREPLSRPERLPLSTASHLHDTAAEYAPGITV
jgi:hypothetical protein